MFYLFNNNNNNNVDRSERRNGWWNDFTVPNRCGLEMIWLSGGLPGQLASGINPKAYVEVRRYI